MKIQASTQKARILVVEDDPRQVEAAKRSLFPHEVVVLEGPWGVHSLLENGQFDLVLTDLELPDPLGGPPSPMEGLSGAFGVAVKFLVTGKIKGVGMLSNYEHHLIREESPEEAKKYEGVIDFLGILGVFGKSIFNGEVKSLSDRPLNFIVDFDRPIEHYTHYLDDRGNEQPICNLPSGPEAYELFRHGAVLLKCWRQVADALLMGDG